MLFLLPPLRSSAENVQYRVLSPMTGEGRKVPVHPSTFPPRVSASGTGVHQKNIVPENYLPPGVCVQIQKPGPDALPLH